MSMYRVVTNFTGPQGSPWVSTQFFDAAGGTAQQAVVTVGTMWGAIDNRMATTVLWATEPDVATIDETTGDITGVTSTTPQSGAGSGSGNILPIVTQGLIQLRTGVFLNGREVRGRIFIPGLTENDNDTGVPNAGILAVVNPAAAAAVADANSRLVVYTRANGAWAEAVTASMASYWSYLRTRRD
jgi:hypothetical protein